MSARGMSCQFCGKQFTRGFNLRRHEKEYCPLRDQEKNMSDSESQITEPEDNDSTASNHDSDSSMVTVDETEEGEIDPWAPLVEEAMQINYAAFEELKMNFIASGLDDQSAIDKANSIMLPKLQKELESIYIERLLWMKQLKKDPVHKKIMHTKDEFVENDDFGPEEALEAAVDKRKFLIKGLLKNYNFTEENDNDDAGDDNHDTLVPYELKNQLHYN